MKKLRNILMGTWLSVGGVPMWSMHQLSPAPQEARDNAGTVQVCFMNKPEYCTVCMVYKQGKDNFRSKFQVPFHPNIMTDRPFFEKNLQSIVDILQEDGEPITNERWGTLVHVLEHGLDEGQVQQDSVARAVGEIPDDKINTITDQYNDMLDQIRTFIVEGIERIIVLSNGSYFTTQCISSGGLYEFNLPLKAEEKAASRVARSISRFLADLARQRDEFTPSTIDPMTQKICNKMARPRFVAKSPEQQTRILRRAIWMILMGRGYTAEGSCRLASDIVDQWSQLKEQLDNDVTWMQDSDYHVKNVGKGQKFITKEGKDQRLATVLQEGRQTIDDNTPVRTSVGGPRTEYMKTFISGGVSTDARPFVPTPPRKDLVAALEKTKVLLAEAEKKGDDYSVGVTKLAETYRLTTAGTKTGSSATAEVPGTNTDTSATPVLQRPRYSPLTVRYGLPFGYKF